MWPGLEQASAGNKATNCNSAKHGTLSIRREIDGKDYERLCVQLLVS